MFKQLFYIIAVVLLMIMAFRLMKKVDSNNVEDPYKIPERDYDSELDPESSEEDLSEEERPDQACDDSESQEEEDINDLTAEK